MRCTKKALPEREAHKNNSLCESHHFPADSTRHRGGRGGTIWPAQVFGFDLGCAGPRPALHSRIVMCEFFAFRLQFKWFNCPKGSVGCGGVEGEGEGAGKSIAAVGHVQLRCILSLWRVRHRHMHIAYTSRCSIRLTVCRLCFAFAVDVLVRVKRLAT